MVHPSTLDWGTVPVLWCVEKHVTITNESQIAASFSAFMVTAVNYFVSNMVKVKFCNVCKGVNVTRSSTPFRVFLRRSYIGSVSTGGNRGFGFLAKKLPAPQPIGTKFGPHILGTKTHRHNFFREWEIPLTREN